MAVNKKLILAIFAGVLIGVGLVSIAPQETYSEGFNDGVYYSAAYTTESGNFTYIDEGNALQTRSLNEYCYVLFQNLNNKTEVK